MENTELQADIKRLRRRYRLPITYGERGDWEKRQIETDFHAELGEIVNRHGADWEGLRLSNLYDFVLHAEKARFGTDLGAGIGWRVSWDENGEQHMTVGPIYPTADVTSPVFMMELANLQALATKINDPPPLPEIIDEPTGEKDWRPVREWLLAHQDISYDALEQLYEEVYPNEDTPTAGTIRKKVGEIGGRKAGTKMA